MSGPSLDLARAGRAFDTGRRGSPSLRGERGEITWVGLILLAAAVAGGYLAWVWFPVYFENYAVKQVVRDYMNQAIKNSDDDGLRRNMVLKLRSLAELEAVDEEGRPVKVPAVVVDEGRVVWERHAESQPPMLRVAFEYEREVALPVLERTTTKVFSVDLTNELSRPDWGPPR